MQVERLQLNDFRNFERLSIKLRPRINFFLGENGQGKTNLLEAVYLLCRGQSFRPANADSLLRQGRQISRIAGQFLLNESGFTLDHKVQMTLEPGRKNILLNGKRTNTTTLITHFPIVMFSPESLSVIKEGPEQRRQLIDELLLSHEPRQARLLREYQRALKARNRLLRNISQDNTGGGSRQSQLDALESLNKIYLLLSTHLTTARVKTLHALQPELQHAMRSILDENAAEISVDYVISSASAYNWSESEIFDALHKRHRELASQELTLGSSLVGPHKHDIKLLFSGNDSRFYCSQGQQRALILALKIAQIVYHHRVHQTYPVVLLDDVMSELDAKKRVNLIKFLERISAQILITSTDLTWSDHFGMDRNSVFQVLDGQVFSEQFGSDLIDANM